MKRLIVKQIATNLLNDKFKDLLAYIKDQKLDADSKELEVAFSGFNSKQNYYSLVRCIIKDLIECYEMHIYRCTQQGEYKTPKSIATFIDDAFNDVRKYTNELVVHTEAYERIISKYCCYSEDPAVVFDMIALLALRCNGRSNVVAEYAYMHK